jgi:hypothetical protein
MIFNSGIKTDSTKNTDNNPFYDDPSNLDSGGKVPDLIQQNPEMPLAKRNRQLISWRVPGIGTVEMYINPQQISISEKKVIKTTRTKGGYVMQYWGEELTRIKLSGNTGAASIEGINILRSVYRAEQNAFQQVQQTLADRLQEYTGGTALGGLINQLSGSGAGKAVGSLVNSLVGGSSNPPLLPTLGSLAAAVELFYQGWVFKGFFESFSVDENVSSGPGIFTYQIDFVVLDRRGSRNNFMSWSRSPAVYDPTTGNPVGYYKADSSSTPLSFRGEKNK